MLKGIHRGERSCWIESARRHGAWLIGPPNTPQLGVFLMPYAGTMTPASPVLTAPPATVPLAAPPAAPPAHHPPALPPSAARHMPISATLAANEALAARRSRGEPVLPLAFGEAGLPAHPALQEALAAATASNRYGPVAGSAALREAAAGY